MLPMHQNKDKDLVLYISLYFEKKTLWNEEKKVFFAIKQHMLLHQLQWRNSDNILNFFPLNEYLWTKSEFW